MKWTYLILLIFSGFNQKCYSQNFPLIGSEWYFSEKFSGTSGTGTIIVKCVGDTIINEIPCKIVNKTKSSCDQRFKGFQYIYQSNDSVFHFNQTTNHFELIIVFSAKIGDSWTIKKFSDSEFIDSMYCVVDSLSSIKLNQIELDVQHVLLYPFKEGVVDTGDQLKSKIIEGIGFESALFPKIFTYVCDGNFVKELRCFESDYTGLLKFTNEDCITTSVNTSEEYLNQIKIFPNPVTDFLNVLEIGNNTIENISIFNTSGDFIFESVENNINISSLNSGVYILCIKLKNSALTKRIVKI